MDSLVVVEVRTIVAIKTFFWMIQTLFGAHVKVLRSDNNIDFFNS